MVDKLELENFRRKWKDEIGDDEKPLKRSKVSDEDSQSDEFSSLDLTNDEKKVINQPNTLEPFLIAERLLSGKDSGVILKNPSNNQDNVEKLLYESGIEVVTVNSEQCKTSTSTMTIKRQESYLDIFLKDLVCNLKLIYDII